MSLMCAREFGKVPAGGPMVTSYGPLQLFLVWVSGSEEPASHA